jgi:polysaccharide deacetylase family protein (PEP-CTERM system associated)
MMNRPADKIPAKNILSFEVEDTFHIDSPDFELDNLKSRIIPNLIHLLELLDNHKARATFFVLGWVASRFPEIISLLDSRGHEVACHGFSHGDITKMEPARFQNEIRRSGDLLKEILNKPVLGFKASSGLSIKENYDLLNEISAAGFLYDCSTKSGLPEGKSTEPYDLRFPDDRVIKIVPQSAYRLWGLSLRYGDRLRLYPLWITLKAIEEQNRDGRPAMINLKLWELDKYQSRSPDSDYLRYRRYGNLNLAEEKLARILDHFEFTTCAEALGLEY